MIEILLLISILLCGLVSGLVFTFAILIMPSFESLTDLDYLQRFKDMDTIIQKNHPLFILVWLGSVLAIIALAVLSIFSIEGINLYFILCAAAVYIFGVQFPTIRFNIPLNNSLQEGELKQMDKDKLNDLRKQFESRWVPSNTLRTFLSILVTILLIVVALGL